jgi:hypothetical protein
MSDMLQLVDVVKEMQAQMNADQRSSAYVCG